MPKKLVHSQNFDTEIIITSMSVDELFLAIQPDEKSRAEALKWIAENPVKPKPK